MAMTKNKGILIGENIDLQEPATKDEDFHEL